MQALATVLGFVSLFALVAMILALIQPRWVASWMKSPSRAKAFGFYLLVFVAVGIAVGITAPKGDKAHLAAGSASQAPQAIQSATAAVALPPLPADEAAFIAAINDARAVYGGAANDMAKGAARVGRKGAVCAALKSGKGVVKDWVGQIAKLSSNTDGKGVLVISIAEHASISTLNNEFSDAEYKTLIDPASEVYQRAVQMKEGDTVVFSGNLFRSEADCAYESSVTLDGSMTEPAYILRFSKLRPSGS